jgi:exodeoxyribonuclease V gamma subunit
LANFAEEATLAGMNDLLDWRCVRDELAARLAEPERAYRFFGGGITVCGMVPLRAVPFRVICLVGMNEGAFPRRDRASPFDRAEDRRAEPSTRDEDRYLFLQQLMAARERFCLSWVGEDARDGSKREPSAVVAELIAILGQYGVDEKACVVEHPLQPFSPRLFDGADPALFTYDKARQSAERPSWHPQRFVDGALPAAHAAPIRLDRREWQRFWRNPAAAYFARSLGVELVAAPEAQEDADDLALSGLGRYSVFNTLLDTQGKFDAAAQCAWLRASAALPAGVAGVRAFYELQAPLVALTGKRDALVGVTEPAAGAPFELELDYLVLSGTLPEHRNGLLLHALRKQAQGNRLLQAWLDYLLLAAQREDAALVLLEWDEKKSKVMRREVRGISAEQARIWLNDLAGLCAKGLTAPLWFFPQSSHAYAERRNDSHNPDDHEKALHAARAGFFSSRFHRGDDRDPAFALATRGVDLFEADAPESRDFADCALHVFAPLLTHLQTVEPLDADREAKPAAPRRKRERK